MVVIGVLAIIACFLLSMIWTENRHNRKYAEEKKKHDEDVTDIFVKIGDQFAHHGFVFEHKFKGGEHSGRTLRTDPGVVISFSSSIRGCYRVDFQRNDSDDDISPSIREARDTTHSEIVERLTDPSTNFKHWFIKDIFELKRTGIEQVVTDLVGLQQKYDEIWSDLEACRIQERLAGFLNLYEREYDRYMQAIYLTIDRHFPTEKKETKTAS
ncbi:MAG: hypothetical protein A2735_02140 [Candidatus Yanofskybacteria bacterium RIFCSPHIGHO2_01_FULL_41_21]|uniref:Uncharacterized protein n=1 Tax=Candidatus Yanofskybacteria bacterium RIFCSPHIGHO2_01_FULL_41_21 TaxID=1802660 RepID=A0A1F8E9D6_9BACT|nr:MAG: hypothetical protein A2735_02140 [Candidatus Yanofskybacteria bacterium RIFCSPHIGHO2_01_FULL_41_21]